jgi:ribosomal 50S subunit-associated protein YjgA (DUF615 family)
MDIDQVLSVRAKAETVEGVREALEEVRTAGAAARHRLAELEAARVEMLLSGSASAVAAAEAALAEARRARARRGDRPREGAGGRCHCTGASRD